MLVDVQASVKENCVFGNSALVPYSCHTLGGEEVLHHIESANYCTFHHGGHIIYMYEYVYIHIYI